MSPRPTSSLERRASAARRRRAASALAACLAAGAADAATLNLTITDAAGAPLPDAVALLEPANGRAPTKPMADAEVGQRKRQYTPRVTLITVGTKVNFPNFDTVRHHVYSLSPIKTFDIKLYSGVPAAPVVFDKPGVAVLGCNIHDSMAAWIVVADTPWSALTAASGTARIENVPAGSYRLRYWHPSMPPNGEPAPVAIAVGAADLEQSAKLPVRNEP